MSGYGNPVLSGLRWSLGSKDFVTRLEASVNSDLRFHRIRRKTDTSEAPYWKAAFKGSITLGGLDNDGNFVNAKGTDTSEGIGDLDWQNKNECLTWFNQGYYSYYRYSRPSPELENTYLYRKGKITQSCGGKIVGAAINTLIGRRYLAVTVRHEPNQENDTGDILSLWSVRDFENDGWTLIQEFPPLADARTLFTSVFFNSKGTEAVAVVERYYTPAAVNQRLRLTVTKNEVGDALVASLTLENPYPNSEETVTWESLSRTTTLVGTSLLACDYQTFDGTDIVVDLLFQVEGTSTRSLTATISEDQNGEVITYWYRPTSETITQTVSGNFLVHYSHQEANEYAITLPGVSSVNSDFTVEFNAWNGDDVFSGESVEDHVDYQLVDVDLRSSALWVKKREFTTTVLGLPERPPLDGWKIAQSETVGTETYQLVQYDLLEAQQVVTYEYEDVVDTGVIYEVSIGFNTAPTSHDPPWEASTVTVPLNSYEGLYTCWNWDWLKGQMKTLTQQKNTEVFLSYLYARDESEELPAKTFYLTYLTDGDPKALSGIAQDTFFTLSVI